MSSPHALRIEASAARIHGDTIEAERLDQQATALEHDADLRAAESWAPDVGELNDPFAPHGDRVAAAQAAVLATTPDVDDFLAEPEPEFEYIVPGLIEKGDRVILTALEGGGKSTLLRQFGVQSASGIHPFTHEPMDPVRVLLVDCENSRRHVRRKLRPLRDEAAGRYVTGNFRVHIASAGIDLLKSDGVDEVRALLDAAKPDLLIIGPIYKLASGDPTREEIARSVCGALDQFRSQFGVALLIEAHTPYSTENGKRQIRPYGASLWSRWPEFGIYLDKTGKLEHWRGPRDERDWPACLRRSEPWPWIAAPDLPQSDTGEWRPTGLMARASLKLADLNARGDYPTRSALADQTRGKRQYVLTAIESLLADGYADFDPDGKHLIHVRTFTEEAP